MIGSSAARNDSRLVPSRMVQSPGNSMLRRSLSPRELEVSESPEAKVSNFQNTSQLASGVTKSHLGIMQLTLLILLEDELIRPAGNSFCLAVEGFFRLVIGQPLRNEWSRGVS